MHDAPTEPEAIPVDLALASGINDNFPQLSSALFFGGLPPSLPFCLEASALRLDLTAPRQAGQ
jgi:hypothetical protein